MSCLAVIAVPEWEDRYVHGAARVRDELGSVPTCRHYHQHKECLPAAIEAIERGIAAGVDYILTLPCDAILCDQFGEVLANIIAARPDDVIDMISNHRRAPLAYQEGHDWYTTDDGSIMCGGLMRTSMWCEYLDWRKANLQFDPPIDQGLNMWAMTTGRLIYKPLPSPVDHDISMGSLNGYKDNPKNAPRTSQVWFPDMDLSKKDWKGPVRYLGRSFAYTDVALEHFIKKKHEPSKDPWASLRIDLPKDWDIERMYESVRGTPVSDVPMVVIVTPKYRETYEIVAKTEPSRLAVEEDLQKHGYLTGRITIDGDSLVQRMRQRAVHHFLRGPGTHLLWWDADIECIDPTCVRAMLESGHDIVAGACPFKAPGGQVVCNLTQESCDRLNNAAGENITLENGCIEVRDAGTGFMLASRKAHIKMMQAHPELLHWSKMIQDMNEPLWAIYDSGVIDQNYESEDYRMCRYWQELGGKVYVYVPGEFRHYGIFGFGGSFMEQYGLQAAE